MRGIRISGHPSVGGMGQTQCNVLQFRPTYILRGSQGATYLKASQVS